MITGLTLTSTAFENNGTIPAKYTCDGNRGLSPPLYISGVPKSAKSLALIVDDPDVPKVLHPDGVFDHWVLYNISADAAEIPEGADIGTKGLNGAGALGYAGPCPPPEYEPKEHRYIFTLYALSGNLEFSAPPIKKQVLDALSPMLVAKTELIGRYVRK